MDAVLHGRQERSREVGGDAARDALVQLGVGDMRSPVDCVDEVQPPLLGVHLGDVDVELADGMHLKADAVPLAVAVRRRAPRVPDGRLKCVETVVERRATK
jgi:hypothetical protein